MTLLANTQYKKQLYSPGRISNVQLSASPDQMLPGKIATINLDQVPYSIMPTFISNLHQYDASE